MCPDLIHRYISNILTIDQVETLTNKSIDGDLNTLSDIAQTSLKQITDKTKLPSDIIYAGTPYTQSITHHTDINVDGLMDGQVLKWDSATSKWKNVTPQVESLGDITGAANLAGTGSTVFASEVAGILNFNRIRSMSTPLTVDNAGNEIQFSLAEATTTVKGVVQLNTDGGTDSTRAIIGSDARLVNNRNPNTHASSHAGGAGDPIKLDDLADPDDNTDLNASTVKHGLMMRYPNDTSKYLRGDGTWVAPPVPSTGVVVLAREVSELYIASNSNENTIFSYTVGGGTLGTNGILRITVGGYFDNDTGSSETCHIRVKIDNTIIWGDAIGTIGDTSNNQPRGVHVNVTISQNNSSTSQKCNGLVMIGDDHPATDLGCGQDDDEGCYDCPVRGYGYIDWSTSHTVSVTVELSASSGNLSFTRDVAFIEQL